MIRLLRVVLAFSAVVLIATTQVAQAQETSTYAYDAFGRLVSVQRSTGVGSAPTTSDPNSGTVVKGCSTTVFIGSGPGSSQCVTPALPTVDNISMTQFPSGYLSPDHRFLLGVQTDENVVLYFFPSGYGIDNQSTALWSSATNTSGSYSATLAFQTDGNLVAYEKPGNRPIWYSGTGGNPGATLAVQNDGNVVIYAQNGDVLWNTHTAGH